MSCESNALRACSGQRLVILPRTHIVVRLPASTQECAEEAAFFLRRLLLLRRVRLDWRGQVAFSTEE